MSKHVDTVLTRSELIAKAVRAALMVTACLGVTQLARAQQAAETSASADAAQPTDSLEEVVVSAQRRVQTSQDVAMNLQAFSGEQLKEQGITTVDDVAKSIPNVQFDSFYPSAQPNITIRGIGVGNAFGPFVTAGAGVYFDDVYMGARDGQMAEMFDEERVEVLLGPQGTLFGRNTTAGAINFIAKKPGDQFEANASVTYGRFNEIDFEGGLTLPISDSLSVRFAGVKHQADGWMYNINPDGPQKTLDNTDNWGARSILRWKPNENMDWYLNVHGSNSDSASPAVSQDLGSNGTNQPNYISGYQGPTAWNQTSLNTDVYALLHTRGVALNGDIKFGDITLTSISAYDHVDANHAYDQDGSPFYIAIDDSKTLVDEWSQELRLSGKEGPYDWVAGVYGDRQHVNYYSPFSGNFDDPRLYALGATYATVQGESQDDASAAAFGDLRYALATAWTVDVGARYTYERKSESSYQYFIPYPFAVYGAPTTADNSASWKSPSGRAALEWRPQKGLMFYTSYGRGFKSGGLGNAQTPVPINYQPEYDNNYELGAKTSWFDDRLIANADVFYLFQQNAQELAVTFDPSAPLTPIYATKNAASGRSHGAEFELEARPIRDFSTSVNIGLLRTKFEKFIFQPGVDLSGHAFTTAPNLSLSWTAQYTIELGDNAGSLSPNVDLTYKGGEWYDPHEITGLDWQGGYTLINAAIPWHSPDKTWEASIWSRNIANKHYYYEAVGTNGYYSWGAGVSYHAIPRTYGITINYNFK